jgi:threonine/homoserine/homoserine lactone efflux protein
VLAVAGPGDASSHGKPATWVSVLKLVLGLLLLLLAWHGRPRPGHEVEAPKWMGSIERFTPGKAVGAGAVLSGANPKNLLLAIGAAAAIAQTGIGSGDHHRSQADRRRDQRLQQLTISAGTPRS